MEGHSPQTLAPSQMDWFVVDLWGNAQNNERMLDVTGFGDLRNQWPGNPSVFGWVLKNGVYAPNFPGSMCGDELLLAALEERSRRRLPNKESYFRSPYMIDEINTQLKRRV